MDLESETGTLCSFPAGEDLIRETLEDELQKLQLENVELKSKYKAVKNELQNYQTLNNELESEIAMLASKEKKYPTGLIDYKTSLTILSSQSRIEQLESEIEKYQVDLRTEATNNQMRLNELELENRRLASNEKNLRSNNEARINELNELLNWHKASSQSRKEQLESEIEKYQRDLRTEARNNELLVIENRRLASEKNLEKLQKEFQIDFEKETKSVRQYNRLVKC